MQRRTLLKLGAGSAALLAVAGTGVALWRPGWQNGHLTKHGRALFAALALGVLDGLVPTEAASRQRVLDAHVDRVDATLAGFTPSMQAEVAQLTALLCTAPGRLAFTGLNKNWAQADATDVHQVLGRLRDSSIALRQQAFHALRDLSNGAWFADPANARAIGYPGPSDI